jgi:hypothetical protein
MKKICMKNISILIVAILVSAVVGGFVGYQYAINGSSDNSFNVGSIQEGQGYYATSSPMDTTQNDGVISYKGGMLGSVNLLGNSSYEFCLYDATTTVAANRPLARQATSSALLACFDSASLTVSYVFDAITYDGIYIDYKSGRGTTTITYR